MVGRNLRAADWITACSHAMLRPICALLPPARPIVSVIHNALPMPQAAATTPNATGRIAFLGRLVRQKGADVLVAAMALLAALGWAPTLTIVGDGEERGKLRPTSPVLVWASGFVSSGRSPMTASRIFLSRAQVIVIPSRAEGFGLVALEAAQSGRPVVGSAVDGLPEVVADGDTGLLVPPGHPAALAKAIAALLDEKARARAMGMAARRRAAALFDWTRFADAYEQLFHRIAHR